MAVPSVVDRSAVKVATDLLGMARTISGIEGMSMTQVIEKSLRDGPSIPEWHREAIERKHAELGNPVG